MQKITLLSILLFSSIAIAQEKQSGFSLDNISSSIGFTINQTKELSLDMLGTLAPNSILLNKHQDLLGSRSSQPSGYANGISELQLNAAFRSNKRNNHRIQFGLTYQQRYNLGRNDGRFEQSTVDTLVSQQNQTAYPVDSFAQQSLLSSYSSEVLRLMGSYRVHQNISKKWALYYGLGLSASLSFNNETSISYHEISGRNVNAFNQSPAQGTLPIEHSFRENEIVANGAGFSLGAFLPVGIEYTLGKWESKINTLALYLEAQPGYFAQYIPEINSYTNTFFSTQTLGIRIGL